MENYESCVEFISKLSNQSISVFVGAGISRECGMPDWGELVEPYAKKLGINKKDLSYPRILQYSLKLKADYSVFLSNLKLDEEKCHPQVIHRLIARLGLPRIWTTNYDGLLEEAYRDESIPYQVVAEDDDLYNLDYRCNQIIKMHGSLTKEKETDIVLLESEYENYIFHRKEIASLLKNDIKSKSVLYFGFSFDDPNLRRIVSAVWSQKEIGYPSFLFTVPPKEKKKQIYYRCWKDDLARYNIKVVELSEYSQIGNFLYKVLEKRFGKTILLLGKRDDTNYNLLSYQIGYRLAEAGYKIHSGGGPNIAQSLTEGAWKYLEEKSIPIEDKIVFHYRYNGGSTNPRKGMVYYCGETRSEVRRKMITPEKICLLIGDEPITESGIQEEIGIAYQKGARIIAVGCSGDLSRRQWEAERHNYNLNGCFEEKKDAYEIINNDLSTEDEIAKAVVELADYLLVRNYES